jgi:hypothetical protein
MTQCEKIYRYMKEYGSITSLEAMREFGCMRLASRITDLKAKGHSISKTTVKSKNRYGDTIHYARYAIKEQEKNA